MFGDYEACDFGQEAVGCRRNAIGWKSPTLCRCGSGMSMALTMTYSACHSSSEISLF